MSLTDYRSLYDKDFIGAWDLTDGDLTVTIKRCVGGQLTAPGGRKSKKPVIYMTHTEKGFALNATNGKTIAAMYGNHVEKWAGKKITLYKSMTRSPQGDGEVECIRVRPTVPRGERTAPPPLDHSPGEESALTPMTDGGAPINEAGRELPAVTSASRHDNRGNGIGTIPSGRPAGAVESSSPAHVRDSAQQPAPASPFTDDAETRALEIENALDIGGSVIRAKFRGVMSKNGWKEYADIPAEEFKGAMKFISTEIDKKNAREGAKA